MKSDEPSLSDEQEPDRQEPDLERLVAFAAQGNKEAFTAIVFHYHAFLLRIARQFAGPDGAEDIVQEAWLLAWSHLDTLHDAGALRPWLARIVTNQGLSVVRRQARARTLSFGDVGDLEQEDPHAVSTSGLEGIEGRWDLDASIEQLPEQQRVVFHLHFDLGLTIPQTATHLNTSSNTIKKRIQGGLRRLRRLLG